MWCHPGPPSRLAICRSLVPFMLFDLRYQGWSFLVSDSLNRPRAKSLQDTDFLKLSDAFLASALPFAFRTVPDNNYVTRALSRRVPPGMQISKVYYDQQADALRQRYAQADDTTRAGELSRANLFSIGRDKMSKIDRWEQWEASLPKYVRDAFLDLFKPAQARQVTGPPFAGLTSTVGITNHAATPSRKSCIRQFFIFAYP